MIINDGITLMNTVIRDWYIVSIFDCKYLMGQVIWGYVVYDSSYRYLKDDFICTSKITHINSSNELVTTQTGNLYQLLEKGRLFNLRYEEFELLQIGFSPEHIKTLRLSPSRIVH